MVLENPISGYDALLGEDYLRSVGAALRLTPTPCALEIGTDPSHLLAKLSRPLQNSTPVLVSHAALGQTLLTQILSVANTAPTDEVASLRKWKRLRHSIDHGKQVT